MTDPGRRRRGVGAELLAGGGPAEPADAETDCLNRIHREAAARAPGVTVVDLAGWVCPGGTCRTEQDEVELRPDGLHFEGASGVWAAQWLLAESWSALGAPASSTTG